MAIKIREKKLDSKDSSELYHGSGKSPLEIQRHSAEHVMAMAITRLWPRAKLAIGPAIESGFYQDFEIPGYSISPDDFSIIEKEMTKIQSEKLPFIKSEKTVDEAIEFYISGNQVYKAELVKDLKKSGENVVTIYTTGEFVDLCRGPHVSNTSEIGVFKLDRLAGAYWRGSEKNPMLQRLYGLCFHSRQELDQFLKRREETEQRDHRRLGRELDLFCFSESVGPGLPLFTPKGTIIRRELENFVRSLQEPLGYTPVLIPHLGKIDLYKKSGHWDKFRDKMFSFVGDEPDEQFALKPMNCPHHIELFASRQRSYREMPQRYSEITACYRNEKAGELIGLSRVYMLTQDDAHVFCTESQAVEESLKVYSIIHNFYKAFDFGMEMRVCLSLRDPKHPENYLGDNAVWEKSQKMMKEVAKQAGLEVYEGVGEAAFYAPKLDFMASDSLGREWQLATIQLDLNFPDRFDISYIDKDGTKKRPVIIHRAILGSVERFMSILIEHYAGAFPLWLSPVQAKIIPISEKQLSYATTVAQKLKDSPSAIRVELDDRNQTLPAKIRDAQLQKIPYMIILGDREVEKKTVSVRLRNGLDHGQMSLEELLAKLQDSLASKSQL